VNASACAARVEAGQRHAAVARFRGRIENELVIDAAGDPAGRYEPGVCNIGPAEIARRRRSAITATAITLLVAAGILLARWPDATRLALLPFASATAVTWLQVIRRFCVAFGAAGILNFGGLGTTVSVEDAEARAADRRTAFRMIFEGLVYGAVVTLLFWIVPVWFLRA
jgi:ferric-dicitrate binding protein FerR (iron transport regulator)